MGCIRLRATPKPGATELGCIYAGTSLNELGSAPYWIKVSTNLNPPSEGWVLKRFVTNPASPPSGGTSGAAGFRPDAWLEVHFVDVGQGDAIWIRTFNDNLSNGRYEGRNIVIDGGPDASDGNNEFLKYLQRHVPFGSDIDALIVSHPHNDHYPGAIGVLSHYDVREYFDSGYPKGGVEWPKFRSLVDRETSGGQPAKQNIGFANFGTPNWGTELNVKFLYAWPGAQATDLGTGNTVENNSSVVLRLTYGDHSFLFMGDAEGKERDVAPDQPKFVENRLLLDPGPAALKSTVLKIGHHGSETSSTLPFLRAVNPDVLVAMSGRKNFNTKKQDGTFLPDASTLARYCSNNPKLIILRTDQDDKAEARTTKNDADGDHIVIRTNGKQMEVKAFSNGVEITPQACRP